MSLWMITGAATDDGAPIYLQDHARWTRVFAEGLAVEDKGERDELLELARSQQRIVCDPYTIAVRRGAEAGLEPTSLRERIRAEGPTVAIVRDEPTPTLAPGPTAAIA